MFTTNVSSAIVRAAGAASHLGQRAALLVGHFQGYLPPNPDSIQLIAALTGIALVQLNRMLRKMLFRTRDINGSRTFQTPQHQGESEA